MALVKMGKEIGMDVIYQWINFCAAQSHDDYDSGDLGQMHSFYWDGQSH